MSDESDAELVRRMTAAMREADKTFERVGGSTRHHVRDCLLPVLEKHGLELHLSAKSFGACKNCGCPLLMVKVYELKGNLVAVCVKCDVVGGAFSASGVQS